jgi:hypothetical protein
MKKFKQKNKFDLLVEDLTEKFSKIKNFELLSESKETQQLWNFLIQTIIELQSIKSLFIGIYIPQTNKFIFEWKEEFKKSRYSPFIKVDENLWQHEVHKLIRIGYVTLFHRYEAFANQLLSIVEEKYIQFEDKNISLQQYAEEKFNFKVKGEWHINGFIKKVNWICNSEKHNEGYPKNNHIYYKEGEDIRLRYPEESRIKLIPDNLKNDIEFMISFVQIIFQNVMLIAMYRMAEESFKSFEHNDEQFIREQNEKLKSLTDNINQLIELTKEF